MSFPVRLTFVITWMWSVVALRSEFQWWRLLVSSTASDSIYIPNRRVPSETFLWAGPVWPPHMNPRNWDTFRCCCCQILKRLSKYSPKALSWRLGWGRAWAPQSHEGLPWIHIIEKKCLPFSISDVWNKRGIPEIPFANSTSCSLHVCLMCLFTWVAFSSWGSLGFWSWKKNKELKAHTALSFFHDWCEDQRNITN